MRCVTGIPLSRVCLMLWVLVCLAGVPGCGAHAPPMAQTAPPEVTISTPVVREVTDSFEFTGNTAASEEVEVRARVSGHLKVVDFVDGAEVKQGDLLFEIDPRDYQTALDGARADLARQEALVQRAQADLARTRTLFEKGVRTREEFDQDSAALAVAQAGLAGAKASVAQAELNLGYTRIAAEIGGRTSRANLTAGNLVQAGPSGSAVLTTIVRTTPIYVYFDVDEQTLIRYQRLARTEGQSPEVDHIKQWKIPVQVALANDEDFSLTGLLDFGDNRVDPATGTIKVRAVLENADGALAPGLFVRVRLPFGQPHQAVLISDRAIASDQGQKYVLTVNRQAGEGQNVAEYRGLKLGGVHGGLRAVEEGLKPDEWIITNGLQRVRPGIRVTPHEGPMPAPAGAGT